MSENKVEILIKSDNKNGEITTSGEWPEIMARLWSRTVDTICRGTDKPLRLFDKLVEEGRKDIKAAQKKKKK